MSFSSFVLIRHTGFFFFFNDTATTEIYTLSLHDALPISVRGMPKRGDHGDTHRLDGAHHRLLVERSEEHTSELQSQSNLVCRLLLEKKKKKHTSSTSTNRTSMMSTQSTTITRLRSRGSWQ